MPTIIVLYKKEWFFYVFNNVITSLKTANANSKGAIAIWWAGPVGRSAGGRSQHHGSALAGGLQQSSSATHGAHQRHPRAVQQPGERRSGGPLAGPCPAVAEATATPASAAALHRRGQCATHRISHRRAATPAAQVHP